MARDPHRYFRVEARELIDEMVKAVLELDGGAVPGQVVPRFLRHAHTLKGAARVVRLPEIADHAHAIEDALEPYRAAPAAVPGDQLQPVLDRLDAIERALAELGDPGTAVATAAAGSRAAPAEPARRVRVDLNELDDLLGAVGEARTHVDSLRDTAEVLMRARRVVDRLATPVPGDGSQATLTAHLRTTVAIAETGLRRVTDHLERELDQVGDSAEQLRLLPAHHLFTDLERAARDIARQLRKQVVVETLGGHVRLDADVLEAARAALVQAVRNAVAHGIETGAERLAAGKSPGGRITVSVGRHGRRVVFSCRDDGRGIDLDAVRRAAQRRGDPGAGTAEPGRLIEVLLHGGISTSASVTELSGRGVGLDVAREAAEHLGGQIGIETVTGQGTTVEIDLPLSFSSFEALVVEAGGRPAVIPIEGVEQALLAAPADIARTPEGELLAYEGAGVPFVALATVLELPDRERPDRERPDRERPDREPGGRARPAVIVAGEDGRAAIGIDGLLGTATVVARPVPEGVVASASVAGVWLDGRGDPQLVLDPDGLVTAARGAHRPVLDLRRSTLPILVVDDSLTTRMLEQSILESAGYEVVLASSGEAGLAAATNRPFGLFLVDVEMPGMDGYDFVARTRAEPGLRDVPAIMVTSRGSTGDVERGREAGASAYIVKSDFDQGVLLDRIQELVRTPGAAGAGPGAGRP